MGSHVNSKIDFLFGQFLETGVVVIFHVNLISRTAPLLRATLALSTLVGRFAPFSALNYEFAIVKMVYICLLFLIDMVCIINDIRLLTLTADIW